MLRVDARPGVVIVALLAAWEGAGRWAGLPTYILPRPSLIADTLITSVGLFAKHVPITVAEALLGLVIGNGVAIVLAIILVHSLGVGRAVYPIAIALRSVPFVALAPVLVIWLGNGLAPKIVIVSLVCFFPTLVNVTRGLRAVDPEALELMYSLSANRWQVLWRLRWPSALPFLFSALKISAAGAVLGAIVAEWIGSDLGIGYLVVMSTYEFRIPLLWATITVISAIAMAMFGAVVLAEKLWSYDLSLDARQT